MADDITARLGLDTSPFDRALRGVGKTIDSAFKSIGKAVSGIGGTILGAVGIGALVGLGKSAVEFASHLQDVSDNLGISTDFLQEFNSIMSQAGVSTEQSTKALEKFSRLVGDAQIGGEASMKAFAKHGLSITNSDGSLRTTEELFFDVADAVRKTTDSVKQSAIAFDLFGKGGVKLVGQLKQGSAAFKEMQSSIPKLSQQEISDIDNFGDALDRAGTRAKVAAGHFLNLALNIADVLKAGRGGGQAEADFNELVGKIGFGGAVAFQAGQRQQAQNIERWTKELRANKVAFDKSHPKQGQGGLGPAVEDPDITKLNKELEKIKSDSVAASLKGESQLTEMIRKKLELQRTFALTDDPVEKKKAEVELEKQGLEIAKKRVELADKTREAQKTVNDSNRSQIKELEASERTLVDRSRLTLKELAESPVRFRGRLGVEQIGARNVTRLEAMAERNRLLGFGDLSDAQRSRADAIRAQLTNVVDADRFPFRSMGEGINESERHLNELLALAKENGLLVKIPNAQ